MIQEGQIVLFTIPQTNQEIGKVETGARCSAKSRTHKRLGQGVGNATDFSVLRRLHLHVSQRPFARAFPRGIWRGRSDLCH